MILKVGHVGNRPPRRSKQFSLLSLRTHYLTHTFCFHFCAPTSRVSPRLGALCQGTCHHAPTKYTVNRAGRAWRALGKLPTQLEAALWPHPLNPSSPLLRWQSLARSNCMAPCPGRSGRPEAWHQSRPAGQSSSNNGATLRGLVRRYECIKQTPAKRFILRAMMRQRLRRKFSSSRVTT